MLTQLLRAALADGAPVQVQQLAWALAHRHGSPYLGLLKALAVMPGLCPDIRHDLQRYPDIDVRVAVWGRRDTPAAETVAALRTEKNGRVLAAVLNGAQDVEAVGAELRRRMTKALASAVVATRRFDLPGDVLAAALAHWAGIPSKDQALAVARSGANLEAVVNDSRVAPALRLAAAASTGTPDSVVSAHLGNLIIRGAGADDRETFVTVLTQLAERTPCGQVLDEVRGAMDHIPGFGVAPVTAAFAHWSSGNATSAVRVTATLEAATEPRHLRALWARLNDDQRALHAEQVASHRLCPADVFPEAVDAATERLYGLLDAHPVAFREDEQLFKLYVGRRPQQLREHIDAAHGCPWSQPVPVLCSWAMDVLLEDVSPSDQQSLSLMRAWISLLSRPEFPRERAGELPGFVVAYVVTHTEPGTAWVLAALREAFAALPAGVTSEALALFDQMLTADGPLLPPLTAACTSLHPAG